MVREETAHWLFRHGIQYAELRLRPENDRRHDVEVKEGWLNSLPDAMRNRIKGVFEDRRPVVDMWRRNGLLCFQVDEPKEF